MSAFQAIQVSPHVYWVGAVDWSLREFHGYKTARGTTYNAYLILADEPILIDAVKAPFTDELLERIASVVAPEKIRTIISNHSELDHTGALPELFRRLKPARLVASKAGARDLAAHFDLDPAPTAVADGEALAVGGTTLRFFETRMLHWPDSMFTWYAEDGVLFTQDAFGMHLACARPFADELIDQTSLRYEAVKYFANILLPYAPLVLKLAERLKELNLPLDVIAPDHGPVWRRPEDRGWIVGSYAHWAAQRPTSKALVVYDTMWGSTEKMARALGEGLAAGGADARLLSLAAHHRSDVATELLEAGALLVGSPTLNNQLYPTVADVLTYLKGLRPKHKLGAVFGSHGWAGEAPKQAAEILKAMQVELVGEPLRVKYVPRAEDLERCRALGLAVAERLTAAGRAAG